MYFSSAFYTGEGDKTNTMRYITISNHKLFTSLNRAEPFDTFQESRECVFGRHIGLAPSISAVMMESFQHGHLEDTQMERNQRDYRSQLCGGRHH